MHRADMLALTVLLLGLACGTARAQTDTADSPLQSSTSGQLSTMDSHEHRSDTDDRGSWLRSYEGTVGDAVRITMTLTIDGNAIKGTYFRHEDLQDIRLEGRLEDERAVLLREVDGSGQATGQFAGRFPEVDPEGRFRGRLDREVLAGTWHGADGADPKAFCVSGTCGVFQWHGKGRYFVAGFEDDEVVEELAQDFLKALEEGNRHAVAGMVCYPVQTRVAACRALADERITIDSEEALLEHYDAVFYPEFRQVVLRSIPHCMFAKWSGVMLGGGEIWIGRRDGRPAIIAINNYLDPDWVESQSGNASR